MWPGCTLRSSSDREPSSRRATVSLLQAGHVLLNEGLRALGRYITEQLQQFWQQGQSLAPPAPGQQLWQCRLCAVQGQNTGCTGCVWLRFE